MYFPRHNEADANCFCQGCQYRRRRERMEKPTFTYAELQQAARTLEKVAHGMSNHGYWSRIAGELRRIRLTPAEIDDEATKYSAPADARGV